MSREDAGQGRNDLALMAKLHLQHALQLRILRSAVMDVAASLPTPSAHHTHHTHLSTDPPALPPTHTPARPPTHSPTHPPPPTQARYATPWHSKQRQATHK